MAKGIACMIVRFRKGMGRLRDRSLSANGIARLQRAIPQNAMGCRAPTLKLQRKRKAAHRIKY